MPITATITKKLSDSHYVAIGAYKSPTSAMCGPAEILLKKTPTGLQAVLDSRVYVSKIMDREVEMYVNAPIADVVPEVGKNIELTNFHFKPKAL